MERRREERAPLNKVKKASSQSAICFGGGLGTPPPLTQLQEPEKKRKFGKGGKKSGDGLKCRQEHQK